MAYNTSCMAQADGSTIGIPWFQNMVSKIFVRVLEIANYVALLDEYRWAKPMLLRNAGGGRPGRSFFPMRNSSTKFLPLALVGRLV